MFYEPRNGHGLPHDPFKAIVSPRPIAWVSTLSASGISNLAPFSYFNAVAARPPTIMLSFEQPPGGDAPMKDTLSNLRETKEAVIHMVPHAMRDAMNVSSGPLPPEIDEFERAGLSKAPSILVAPPRVADAPIAMEAKLISFVELPNVLPEDGGPTVAFLEIVGIEIADSVLEEGILKVERYMPLSRLGYRDYTTVRETFSLTRPG